MVCDADSVCFLCYFMDSFYIPTIVHRVLLDCRVEVISKSGIELSRFIYLNENLPSLPLYHILQVYVRSKYFYQALL